MESGEEEQTEEICNLADWVIFGSFWAVLDAEVSALECDRKARTKMSKINTMKQHSAWTKLRFDGMPV